LDIACGEEEEKAQRMVYGPRMPNVLISSDLTLQTKKNRINVTLNLRACSRISYFFLPKTRSFTTPKKVLGRKKRPS
jgi:hypothetical protein